MNNPKKIVFSFIFCVVLMGCHSSVKTDLNSQVTRNNTPFQRSVLETSTVQPGPKLTTSPVTIDVTQIPTMDDGEVILRNFNSIHDSFSQQIKTTGWIRQVSSNRTFNEQTQTDTDWGAAEEWFRFDADGKYVEGYRWIIASDGTIEQESCFQNGRIYNINTKSFNKGEIPTTIDFTGGFVEAVKNGIDISQDKVNFQGMDAWKFSYEIQDGILKFIRVIYFNQHTHIILGKETWLKQADGNDKLVSSTTIDSFEINASPPVEHFQQISNQIPK